MSGLKNAAPDRNRISRYGTLRPAPCCRSLPSGFTVTARRRDRPPAGFADRVMRRLL